MFYLLGALCIAGIFWMDGFGEATALEAEADWKRWEEELKRRKK